MWWWGRWCLAGVRIHKRVINADDEDAAGVLQRLVLDIAGNVTLRARRGEGGRHADYQSFAFQVLGNGDFVAGRVLHELDVGNGIADLDAGTRSCVERTNW